jgi:hypothetical protein
MAAAKAGITKNQDGRNGFERLHFPEALGDVLQMHSHNEA